MLTLDQEAAGGSEPGRGWWLLEGVVVEVEK